jgi:hypothetical protein
MHDHRAPDDGILARQREYGIDIIQVSVTVFVRFNISYVSGMPIVAIRRTVPHSRRIEMSTGCRSAVRTAISELVNVESVLPRSQPGNIRNNADPISDNFECYKPMNTAPLCRTQNGNRFENGCSFLVIVRNLSDSDEREYKQRGNHKSLGQQLHGDSFLLFVRRSI